MVGFFVKPIIFVSLRGGRIFAPDAAIFDGTKRHLGTKYEKNGTKQKRKISRDQTNRGSITFSVVSMTGIFSLCAPCSHYGHHFSFCSPCFVPGCHAFGFKIATAALRPRNDTKSKRFIWKTNIFGRIQLFSIGINVRFSGKTYRFCHCEERSDVAIFKPKAWHPGTKHGIGKRQNFQILIRPAGTPHRRFSGSAISRGASPALHFLCKFHYEVSACLTCVGKTGIIQAKGGETA